MSNRGLPGLGFSPSNKESGIPSSFGVGIQIIEEKKSEGSEQITPQEIAEWVIAIAGVGALIYWALQHPDTIACLFGSGH